MKRRIQAADSIRFCVRGRGAQRLLGQAAQAGLKLERIAPQADGFTAVVSGTGWAKLCQLAGAGGWQVIQMQRRGPGPLAERLLRRPGILAGIGLFVCKVGKRMDWGSGQIAGGFYFSFCKKMGL